MTLSELNSISCGNNIVYLGTPSSKKYESYSFNRVDNKDGKYNNCKVVYFYPFQNSLVVYVIYNGIKSTGTKEIEYSSDFVCYVNYCNKEHREFLEFLDTDSNCDYFIRCCIRKSVYDDNEDYNYVVDNIKQMCDDISKSYKGKISVCISLINPFCLLSNYIHYNSHIYNKIYKYMIGNGWSYIRCLKAFYKVMEV